LEQKCTSNGECNESLTHMNREEARYRRRKTAIKPQLQVV
jgi:hypothetical protein